MRQITHERDPNVAVGVPVWSPDGRAIAFVSSRGNPGWTFGVWLVDPDGSNLRNVANPGLGPAWSPDGRWVYYSTRGGAAATNAVLKKVPVEGGTSVTVRTERMFNVIGSDGTTLYYSFARPLMDGTPEFEIRTATPEDAPFRVLARIPASRVPIWQVFNPALSPDGKWLAQSLTDGAHDQFVGAVDDDRRVAPDHRLRRTHDVHRPPRVLVVRRALNPGRGRRGRFRHRPAGRTDGSRTPVSGARAPGRTRQSTGRSGASAGPEITSPSGVNREPWHGQSHVRSTWFHATTQPMCGQRADRTRAAPLWSR